MRKIICFVLSLLVAAVSAGGYQGCLERVWMFQAYQIDGLNDEKDQTIGFQCKGKDWDATAKKCKDASGWKPCRYRGGRCNFDQFMVFIGNAPDQKGWFTTLPDSDRLDVDKTAKQTYDKYTVGDRAKGVKNFGAHLAVKDTSDWNSFIMKVAKVVDDTYKTKMTPENKYLWEDVDGTRDKVITARTGDHGEELVKKAKADLGGSMTIHTQNLGTNPGNGKTWETVDWPKTEAEAIANGVNDADTKVKDFLNNWYGATGDKAAREHLQVIESFKQVRDQSNACRP